MKGAVRVMLLFFSAMSVQRWLWGAGALLLLAGCFIPQPLRSVFILLGLIIPLMPTLFAGGLLLRYFITPIHMRLVPRAREQVLGGMLLATLAIATAATLGAWGAGVDTGLLPIWWLRIAAATSVLLLSQFAVVASVTGLSLWFLAFVPLVQAMTNAGMRAFIEAIGQSELLLVATLGVTWIVFALWFLRARSLKSPNHPNFFGHRISNVTHSPAAAVRTFLSGQPSIGGQFTAGLFVVVLLTFTWGLMALMTQSVHSLAEAITKSVNPTLMLAEYAGIGGYFVVRRSKSLWLRGGRNRIGVFRSCEMQAWINFVAIVTSVFVLVVVACFVAPASRWAYFVTLAFQLCSGIWVLYLGLMHVRGWRALDVVATLVLFAAWILMFANLQLVIDRPWSLPLLVAAMAAVALALRFVAVHRWRRIDWLVCKPPRPWSRTPQAAH